MNIENGFFDDAERMVKFTTKFAILYFVTLNNYSNSGKTTKSWQAAFEALQ
ncbi:hypothetical protein NSTC745_03629 [Nostoc sp. DSM 114161]|jgi:hypothetical protein|uniref:DUF5995 family protein n=1 Tax=Nostoc sp. DSM 114161 TaxID=3440143 RepID=UPI004046623A